MLDLCSGSGVSRTEGNHWQQGHLKKVALIGFIISHGGAVITYHEEALCMKSAFIFYYVLAQGTNMYMSEDTLAGYNCKCNDGYDLENVAAGSVT